MHPGEATGQFYVEEQGHYGVWCNAARSLSSCPKFIEFALTCQASTAVGLVVSTPTLQFHKPLTYLQILCSSENSIPTREGGVSILGISGHLDPMAK